MSFRQKLPAWLGGRPIVPSTPIESTKTRSTATDAHYFSPAGLGTLADRTRQIEIRSGCLDDSEVATLMENDGLFATLLSRVVKDALRGGFHIKLKNGLSPEDVAKVNDRVHEWAVATSIEQTWRQHFVQRNGFGGAVLLEITADRDQSRPRLGQPKKSRFMSLAPGEITGLGTNVTNPFSPDYQLPGRWVLNGYEFDSSWLLVSTTPRLYSTNLGIRNGSHQVHSWTGPSKARQFIEEIKRWGTSLQAATSALQTLSQLVLKSDTFRAVQLRAETGEQAMIQNVYWSRIADLANRRSSMQPIGIGLEEEVEILSGTVQGISDILDRLMIALSAAAEMPMTVAFGVSPGGFGTGESEQKLWAARVSEFRRLELTPVIQWTLERAFGDEAKDWVVCYEPIDTPTALEDAQIRHIQAQIDQIEVTIGMVTPNEASLSRHGGVYSTKTQIDVEARLEPTDLGEPESESESEEPEAEQPETPETPETIETPED